MAWGLVNLWKEGREGGNAVWHGQQPVTDFGRPWPGTESETTQNPQLNFFEKAFPCLFPFGEGGLERDQEVNVSFEDHIK